MAALVSEANAISAKIYGSSSKLQFKLHPSSKEDLPLGELFWKNFTYVLVIRGDKSRSKKINPRQFFRIMHTLRGYSELAAEAAKKTLKDSLGDLDEMPDECVVCMDSTSDICLPCSHAFCSPCIEEWKSTQKSPTCPLCRTPLEGTESESWVMTGRPVQADDLKGFLTRFMDAV